MNKGLLIISLLCCSVVVTAQISDCVGAIPVCGNGDLSLFPQDAGNDDFANAQSNNPSCLFFESRSLWLRIEIQTAGSLGMIITPVNNDCPFGLCDDYDFAVYGPNRPCNNLGSSIRCESANPQLAGIGAETGMIESEPANNFMSGPAEAGDGFVRWLDNVNTGDFYYILIDNFSQQDGFSLEWTGTALLKDQIPKSEGGIDLGPDTINCLGQNIVLDGSIETGTEYRWTTVDDTSTIVNTPEIMIPTGTNDEFILFAETSSGCISADTIEIIASNLQTEVVDVLPPRCANLLEGSATINIIEGADPVLVAWNDPQSQQTNMASNLSAGVYVATIRDALGCVENVTVELPASNPSELFFAIDAITFEQDTPILVISNFSPIDISWNFPELLSCTQCLDPVVTLSDNFKTTLVVTASDSLGCELSDSICLFRRIDRAVYFPNVISPNSDQRNDGFTAFLPANSGAMIASLQVYDRWGNRIFNQENFIHSNVDLGWDGTVDGQLVDPGAFAYMVQIRYENGETEVFSGSFYVMR